MHDEDYHEEDTRHLIDVARARTSLERTLYAARREEERLRGERSNGKSSIDITQDYRELDFCYKVQNRCETALKGIDAIEELVALGKQS